MAKKGASLKMRKAAKLAVEYHGNVSRAMREAGYSPATAKNPKNVTESKPWNDLMAEFLPDYSLAQKHAEFLHSERQIRIQHRGEYIYETEETDPAAIKALDMAYKLKGRYKSDINIGQALVVNLSPEIAAKYAINTSSSGNPDRHPQI